MIVYLQMRILTLVFILITIAPSATLASGDTTNAQQSTFTVAVEADNSLGSFGHSTVLFVGGDKNELLIDVSLQSAVLGSADVYKYCSIHLSNPDHLGGYYRTTDGSNFEPIPNRKAAVTNNTKYWNGPRNAPGPSYNYFAGYNQIRKRPFQTNIECTVPNSLFMNSIGHSGSQAFTFRFSFKSEPTLYVNGGTNRFSDNAATYVATRSTSVSFVSNTGMYSLPNSLKCNAYSGVQSICEPLIFKTKGGATYISITRNQSKGVLSVGGMKLSQLPATINATSTSGSGLTRTSTYNLPITFLGTDVGILNDQLILNMRYN